MKKSTKATRPRANKTGASAAQRPLQHNQLQCAQHHQLNLHHNADAVCGPALLLHSHSDLSTLPTNAIQFEVLPNACADATRQQLADTQLECSLLNLPQISGASIAAS